MSGLVRDHDWIIGCTDFDEHTKTEREERDMNILKRGCESMVAAGVYMNVE